MMCEMMVNVVMCVYIFDYLVVFVNEDNQWIVDDSFYIVCVIELYLNVVVCYGNCQVVVDNSVVSSDVVQFVCMCEVCVGLIYGKIVVVQFVQFVECLYGVLGIVSYFCQW